jgi:predicted DNA-binding transcriptional regulator AlpA
MHSLYRPHWLCRLSLPWQNHHKWSRILLPQHWCEASRRGSCT